jgi:hypothetical protein
MIFVRWLWRLWERIAGPGWKWGEVLACIAPAAIYSYLLIVYADMAGYGWSPVQKVVAFLLVFDVVGGAITFNTVQAKFWYHRPERKFRDFFLFNAVHVHPFIIAWFFFPQMNWAYGGSVYGVMIVSTVVVLLLPIRYKGIAAAIVVVAGCRIFEVFESPPTGFLWFEPVYYMKLLLGHCVPPFGARREQVGI